MTPDSIKASYRRMLDAVGEPVYLRRYVGAGPNRPRFDYGPITARVTEYSPAELVGNIEQGDRMAILLAEDVIAAELPVPLVTNDKLVVRGKELNIQAVDDNTRRVRGVLIAYELQVRG